MFTLFLNLCALSINFYNTIQLWPPCIGPALFIILFCNACVIHIHIRQIQILPFGWFYIVDRQKVFLGVLCIIFSWIKILNTSDTSDGIFSFKFNFNSTLPFIKWRWPIWNFMTFTALMTAPSYEMCIFRFSSYLWWLDLISCK
jgi:hypothetical protein